MNTNQPVTNNQPIIANPKDYDLTKFSTLSYVKFIGAALLGLFSFFVTFKISEEGNSTIIVEHIANAIKGVLGKNITPWACVLLMCYGVYVPVKEKTLNKSLMDSVLFVFKILGIIASLLYIFKIGPAFLFEEKKMLNFLFPSLVLSLTFIIPIGSAFIVLLTDYGLMEFTGVFARPFMRPVYKTPGRAAIDAVASFVGSYSLALLITGKQYREGYYSKKEAVIVATGFSTVSATFCIIVAKTLGLMDYWNLFFWISLLVTFIVSAITVRIYPINKIPDEYAEGVSPKIEEDIRGFTFKRALFSGLTGANESVPLLKNIFTNLFIGLKVTAGITSTIMSIGLLGLLLEKFTPLFSILGYLFYPITLLLRFPEAKMVATAVSTSIAEMFLPAALAADSSSLVVRFVVGVTCISEILFFSASIPCMISMGIPIKIKDILVIWFERVVFTLLIATPIAYLLFQN